MKIWTMPCELPPEETIAFEKDDKHKSYDAEAAQKFWHILVWADDVLKEFRAPFLGKVSPVHFFWGSFDMAVTRFVTAFASREFLTRLFEGRQGPWRDVEFLFAAPNSRYAFSTVSNDDRPPRLRSRAAPRECRTRRSNRLDHHASVVLSGEEDPGPLKAHRMGAPGRERRAAARPGLGLVAEKCELLGRRADPKPGPPTRKLRRFRVFAQKALARVDGVASGLLGDGVEPSPVEIGRRSERSQRCALPPEFTAP